MKDDPNLFDVKRKAKRVAAPPLPNGIVQRLLGIWVGLFEAKFHEKPMILPRDGAALKRLVALAGAEAVERRLPKYLALEDRYIAGEGYPLALLQSSWNRLIIQDRVHDRTPDAARSQDYLRKLKGGQS